MTPTERTTARLNSIYSTTSMRRRYEVWFLRLALADGSGAWWFRYLLMNLGRGGCATGPPGGEPAQVWATWFPRGGRPHTFIQGYGLQELVLSHSGVFDVEVATNRIREDACRGEIEADGHKLSWDLRYRSSFAAVVSNVGWIGFSKTPHSDAVFSGEIRLDGRTFSGEPLAYGVQGHNCGYRHRNLWTWSHAHLRPGGHATTFEALVYELPLGMLFRKALFWHEGRLHTFHRIKEVVRDRSAMRWKLECAAAETSLAVDIDGSGPSLHQLPYLKTDCSGTFEVRNNSLARGTFRFRAPGRAPVDFESDGEVVLEMTG